MSSLAHVQSIAALDEMNNALKRFQSDDLSALNAADVEIKRTLAWLQERLRYWQNELRRRQQALVEAQRAWQACLCSGDREHPPDCRAFQAAVERTRRLVQEAQRELQVVVAHSKRVEEAVSRYQSVARSLSSVLHSELLQASSFLNSRANILHAYASSGGGSLSSGNSTRSQAGAHDILADVLPQVGNTASEQIGNTDLRMVAIADIDLSDSHIKDAADFKKVAPDQMKDGLNKLLDVVLPAIKQGANGDYFARLDASKGLDNANGYLHIYHAFFDDVDAIRLSNENGRLTVVNGYHRLFIAQQLGITHIPARVF